MVHRFCVAPDAIASGRVVLPDAAAEQVRKVLRLRAGEGIAVFDGSGAEWSASLDAVGRDSVTATLIEQSFPEVEASVDITLLVALIKAERFEIVLQKATELGVCRFVPFVSERVQGGDAAAPSKRRIARWNRIVTEATEQSGRVRVPRIDPPTSMAEAVAAAADQGPVILLWEAGAPRGFRTVLEELISEEAPSRLSLVIGPVGGIATREVEEAMEAGAVVAGLGPRVLRAETAAVAALTASMHQLGQLGG